MEPVREEQVPVVHRDQQVGHQPGDGHVPVLVLAGLDVDDLLGRVAARPRTGRCLDLMEVEDVRGERRADEPVGRDRGMEEAHLQRDEPLLPQVDGLLDGLPLPVPDVEPSAVLPRLDVVEVEPGVVGRRGRPLRRHHHVLPGLVPEVVVEFDLARWLPAPVDGEVRLVQFEESARQLPVGVAQHREDDLPVGDAVDGVGGAQVLVEHLPWLDDPLQFGLAPVRRVDDVDARGALPGDDEVAPLQAADVTGGGAGVPPEMVEFVAAVGHLDAVDHLRVRRRVRVEVDDRQEVRRVHVRPDVQPHHVGQLLGVGLLDRRLRGGVPWPLVVVVMVVRRVRAVFRVTHTGRVGPPR